MILKNCQELSTVTKNILSQYLKRSFKTLNTMKLQHTDVSTADQTSFFTIRKINLYLTVILMGNCLVPVAEFGILSTAMARLYRYDSMLRPVILLMLFRYLWADCTDTCENFNCPCHCYHKEVRLHSF